MLKTRVFNKATPSNVIFAQRFTALIWVPYLLVDNYNEILFLGRDLFLERGIYNFLGNNDYLFSFMFWSLFKLVLFLFLFAYIYKLNSNYLFFFLLLIYFYEMFKKGFGGHIDHRIATLYLFTLILNVSTRDKYENAQIALLPPVIFFLFQYTCIGLARLLNGFPELFIDDIFTRWLVQRSIRPNYFELQFGQVLVENIDSFYLSSMFFVFTVIELFSIFLLFTERRILQYVLAIHILSHLAIFIFMGVNFFENILILAMLMILDKEK
jgi:hypothetical protein